MLNRRNFLKACGVGVVAPLGLVGKAVPEARQTSMTCSENKHGYDYVIHDDDTGEVVSEGFVPYPKIHYDLGIRHYYVNPKLRKDNHE